MLPSFLVTAKLTALKEQIATLEAGTIISQEDIDALNALVDDTTNDVAVA